jgi:hypothetical protein
MSRNRPNEGIDGKFAVPEVDIFSNHDQQHMDWLPKKIHGFLAVAVENTTG